MTKTVEDSLFSENRWLVRIGSRRFQMTHPFRAEEANHPCGVSSRFRIDCVKVGGLLDPMSGDFVAN